MPHDEGAALLPEYESPMKAFRPSVEEVKAVAETQQISRRDARTHLTRLNMTKAARDAQGFTDLLPLVRVLISLAKFD